MLRLGFNETIGRFPQVCGLCTSVLLKQDVSFSTMTATLQDEEWISARPFKDIPGPKSYPLVGNAWRYMPMIGEYHNLGMDALHRRYNEQYGDIMKLTGMPGSSDTVFLFSAEEVEKAFRNEGKWPIRDFVPSFSYYRTVTREDLFKGIGTILATQGEDWQKFRSKVNPAMMQPRNTKLYINQIDDISKEFVHKVRRLKDHKEEMPENFHSEFHKWALESIALVALDKRLGCMADNLPEDSEQKRMISAVLQVIELMYELDYSLSFWKYFSTPAWRRFVKTMDTFTEVALKYVNEAMERVKTRSGESDGNYSILERMLLNEADPRIALAMSLDILFGGIDTTANSTSILLYYLSKNPDKQEKLYEETKKFLTTSENDPITSEKLESMKYLKACTKESMRLSPVAFGNLRTLDKDVVLANYQIPKGTNIFMMHMRMSNKEKYFSQADKFIPERWLKGPNGEPAESKKTHPFVTMPFGYGVRMCVGRRFAELEMETLIARIIRNFKVEYNYGEMEFTHKLVLRPASPLKFKMIERTQD